MQPAREALAPGKPRCLSCEKRENLLRHIASQFRIARAPQRSTKHHPLMRIHQCRKRPFATVAQIAREQFGIGGWV
jgi:hypothetical protein